jgi:hypothetical protein
MRPVEMAMDYIEFCGPAGNYLQRGGLRDCRVLPWAAEGQCLRPNGRKVCTSGRVCRGKERHIVSKPTSSSVNHDMTRSVPP